MSKVVARAWARRLAAVVVVSAGVWGALKADEAEDYTPPPGREWTQPGGHWGNSRYSTLKQITAANVTSLGGAWVAHLNGELVQSAPLVKDGLMFVPTGAQNLYALDAKTGAVVWKYQSDLPPSAGSGLGRLRGATLGEGKVFLPPADTRVVAVDQKTGKVAWTRKIGDEKPEAPQSLAWPGIYAQGLFITGLQLGDIGIRGRVTALDAKTGEEKWRFYIVPAPGERGSETWPKDNDAWRRGGGALWMNPAVDAELGLVYINTGNPWPTWTADVREGDNLYTASVVALDLKTGTYRWHFQLTHHDIWDMDAPNGVVLYDTPGPGPRRKGLAAFGTHGYLFLLDRATGKPLQRIEERPVPQDPSVKTAATQPIPVGADQVLPNCVDPAMIPPGFLARCFFDIYTDAPNVMQPFMGVRQAPTSYNPGLGYFYAVANVRPTWLSRNGNNGGFTNPPGTKDHGVLAAVDARTNKIVWRKRLPHPPAMGSGTMATAGDLVFHGEPDGNFQAYHARTGDLLWQFQTGAGADGAPVSYEIDGTQYVAITAGGGARNSPRGDAVWAFALGGGVKPAPAPEPPADAAPWLGPIAATERIAIGGASGGGRGGSIPAEYTFSPTRARAKVGTTVTWTNTGKTVHSAGTYDGAWSTGPIQPGGTATVTFSKPGTYTYVCQEHPWAIAQLIVE